MFFLLFNVKNFKKKIFKKLSIRLEIASKNDNCRYLYFHSKKLGTTSKKKKYNGVFLYFYVKNFEKKKFDQKLSIRFEVLPN